MKTLLVLVGLFVWGLGCWALGYRTGALDQGMKDQFEIKDLEYQVRNSERAFKDAYDKFVACVREQE